MMLAIEISQRAGSVALRAGDETIHVEHLSPAQGKAGRHGDDLMPAIDRLFARLDLKSNAMTAVAVSIGPGSFTGLRIAVATARMFAEALAAKVIAVPSALVAAENFAPPTQDDSPILVALAGKRDTLWSTLLARDHGHWCIVGEPGLADAHAFDPKQVTCVLADEHLPSAARSRCEHDGIPIHEPRFDASACLRVAERLANAGAFTDPLALLPHYPRRPEAVTIWEQRQKKNHNPAHKFVPPIHLFCICEPCEAGTSGGSMRP